MFSNRESLNEACVQIGSKCGDRAWSFPMDDDFADDLKSDIADVLQCRVQTEADHIYAAIFLRRFVSSSVPWIHLDMGSAYKKDGLGHIASDFTGAGVRLACCIIDHIIKDNLV